MRGFVRRGQRVAGAGWRRKTVLATMLGFAAFPAWAIAQGLPSRVRLPIELAGEDGSTASVTVLMPPGEGERVHALWMQIHGLEYEDMVSVRVNESPWLTLNNHSVAVAEPGKSYGGIGGGFATLKLTLAIPAGSVADGANTVSFRFNRSNGVVSGFRVLAFNFLAAGGRPSMGAEAFEQEDPDLWAAPLPDAQNIAVGRDLWNGAPLVASSLPSARPIRAHCADCHARDGRDLKYFNYSNVSIAARCRFHGLSALQGDQVASYIRALPLPNPGRPWNPPYQPGPGQAGGDKFGKPADLWAAGAGLDAALENDAETLRFLFPEKGRPGEMAITPAAFSSEGHLNPREIPIALQLPDWNHWLPRVHPLDAWGERFAGSAFSRMYQPKRREGLLSLSQFSTYFARWLASRASFLGPQPGADSRKWSPELSEVLYSAQLWQLVKSWEITQEAGLEGQAQALVGADDHSSIWLNTIAAATAPAAANIPDGPNGMGGSALTNEYYNNAWYELQILVNSGNHQHDGRLPVDWVYVAGRVRDLERESGAAEPGRLLVAIVKSMQSTDSRMGPESLVEGWRPDLNIDPRILVSPGWTATFQSLCKEDRREVAESFLSAWLGKTMQYPPAAYFHRAQLAGAYMPPQSLRDITGGRVWEAASQFRSAGVSFALTQRLERWGEQYRAMAELFHY